MHETDGMNGRMLELTSLYLRGLLPPVDGKAAQELARDIGQNVSYAYAVLLADSFGLDIESKKEDLSLFMGWILPSVRAEDPARYRSDPYVARMPFPDAERGNWRMLRLAVAPYELFVSDDLMRERGRVIPRLGFFTQPFSCPAVTEGGTLWMSVTPNEINTILPLAQKARGDTVALGLGLGYYAFHALMNPHVTRLTVVERDENAIALFREFILPYFPREKELRIVQADAFDYLSSSAADAHDTVFSDLWHDVSDGIPLYRRLKELEKPEKMYHYWIEKSIRAYIDP